MGKPDLCKRCGIHNATFHCWPYCSDYCRKMDK